jgi:hypothetical protein
VKRALFALFAFVVTSVFAKSAAPEVNMAGAAKEKARKKITPPRLAVAERWTDSVRHW